MNYTVEQLREWANGGQFALGDIQPQMLAHAALIEENERLKSVWTADDCLTWLYAKGYEEQGALLREAIRCSNPPHADFPKDAP